MFSGQMVWEIMDHWTAGWVFCKIFKFLQTFSLTSSNYMILALSVERHRAVTKPLSVTGSPYRQELSCNEHILSEFEILSQQTSAKALLSELQF